MLLSSSINRPDHVWQETWQWLSDDILYEQRNLSNNQDLQLTNEELQNLTLLHIEELLEANRKRLKEYPSMSYPSGYIWSQLGNRLTHAELDYDTAELHNEFQNLFNSLTDEQRQIFEKVMQAVNRDEGAMFFLSDSFMWRTSASALRSQGHIVLTVASSGVASLLLPGGRTSHSKFKILVPTLENSICNIHQGSELAEILKQTKMIIWDEAPMAHKYCFEFEELDKSLRDIMSSHNNSSSVFGELEFSQWILDVGDGKLSEPNDGYAEIDIVDEFLITNFDDPIDAIVQATYPNLEYQFMNGEFLESRVILASTIEIVDQINDYVLGLIPGEEREYLNSDSIDKSESNDSQTFDVT